METVDGTALTLVAGIATTAVSARGGVRCGARDETPLIATPERWMCERCYADAE